MKGLQLFLLVTLLASLPVFAQDGVDWEATGGMFYDFEADTSEWFSFSCSALDGQDFYIAENPDKSGINTSDSLAVFWTIDACTWEGATTRTKFMPIDFETYPIIKVKVWAPAPDMTFMVKILDFEDSSNSPLQAEAVTIVGLEWEELEFDFSAAPAMGIDYEKITIFPDYNGVEIEEWFIDDIRLDGVPPPSAVNRSSPTQPQSFITAVNYPNPFNPQTTIEYTLPKQSHVTLTIYDAVGQEIVALVNERQNAGIYSIPFAGTDLPSGLFFYRLETEYDVFTEKMLLVK
jgi:hypothetical protein